MTIVPDSHKRIRSGEVSSTLTTKCNVTVLDVYSVEDEQSALGPKILAAATALLEHDGCKHDIKEDLRKAS